MLRLCIKLSSLFFQAASRGYASAAPSAGQPAKVNINLHTYYRLLSDYNMKSPHSDNKVNDRVAITHRHQSKFLVLRVAMPMHCSQLLQRRMLLTRLSKN